MKGHRHRAMPIDSLDEVTHLAADEVAGVKRIDPGDPYLEGHYPDFTIYPGVFILESACRLIEEYAPGAELTGVKSMRFLAPLLPGDTLHLHATMTKGTEGDLTAKVVCRNDKAEKAAQLTLYLDTDA